MLTVIKRLDNRSGHWWLCRCGCGNEKFKVAGSRIEAGKVEDCGCVIRAKNRYDLTGKFGIGYTKKNEEFYFDLEDYEKIKGYTWCISVGYVMSNPNHKMLQLHRIVMNMTDDKIKVDHVNRKRNDCRKENLRKANDFQNIWNMSISKNNTSGVIGVSWSNYKNAWVSIIGVNYRTINLLTTKNFDDAVRARLNGEKKYFGEYAPQKHLYSQYGIEE
jgi:hypothetical protein